MINDIKFNCTGCAACADICPQNCISMQPDGEGFSYPYVDEAACVQCGKCVRICPVLWAKSGAGNAEAQQKQPVAYAAYNKNEIVRLASSSGGIFTLLAEQTLVKGGVVFGAAMREDQRAVVHVAVQDASELEKLRGSKYLQSNTEGIYSKVRAVLREGRSVLFSGTPCQVEALRAFLGKDHENLLCVDLICHGVPSPKVWQRYVDYQEDRAGAPARRTFFRHKKYGWKTFALSFEFSNDKAYEQILSKDLFMQAFLQNACLRPSCHNCAFKKLHRVSDITLADFWGIQNVASEMDDNKGTSLVLIHTEKGKQAFNCAKINMCFLQVAATQALVDNSSMISSSAPHKQRTQFFAKLEKLPFDTLIRRYAKPKRTMKEILVILLHHTGFLPLVKMILRRNNI